MMCLSSFLRRVAASLWRSEKFRTQISRHFGPTTEIELTVRK